MKVFLIVLLVLVLIPFILVLVGTFLPNKFLGSYEQVITRLPEKKDDEPDPIS